MMSARHREHLYAAILAVFLLVLVDLLTNDISWVRSHADMENYKLLFTSGLHAEGLQAPYAYRYLPAYIAKGIAGISGGSMLQAFAWLNRISLFFFLWLVYLLVREYKDSPKAAMLSMVAVGFSFCNLKFLLFDATRPDAMGMLATLLAYLLFARNRFWPLVLVTVIGLQIREFTLIPFLVYLVHYLRKDSLMKLTLGALFVLLAVLLPRILIDVNANLQFVPFNSSGPSKFLSKVLLNWPRHLNILFVLVAYALPVLLVWAYQGFGRLQLAKRELLTYAFAVLALLFLGGTDLARFTAYLFIPLAILFGLNSSELKPMILLLTLAAIFWFNRIGLRIPFEDPEAYRDFYGGVNDRLNTSLGFRWLQIVALLLAFYTLGWVQKKSRLGAGK